MLKSGIKCSEIIYLTNYKYFKYIKKTSMKEDKSKIRKWARDINVHFKIKV